MSVSMSKIPDIITKATAILPTIDGSKFFGATNAIAIVGQYENRIRTGNYADAVAILENLEHEVSKVVSQRELESADSHVMTDVEKAYSSMQDAEIAAKLADNKFHRMLGNSLALNGQVRALVEKKKSGTKITSAEVAKILNTFPNLTTPRFKIKYD